MSLSLDQQGGHVPHLHLFKASCDNSYPAGGYPLSAADCGFSGSLDALIAAPKGGFEFHYDADEEKLLIYAVGVDSSSPFTYIIPIGSLSTAGRDILSDSTTPTNDGDTDIDNAALDSCSQPFAQGQYVVDAQMVLRPVAGTNLSYESFGLLSDEYRVSDIAAGDIPVLFQPSLSTTLGAAFLNVGDAGTHDTLTTALTGGQNDLTFTAVAAGTGDVTIEYVADVALDVTVSGHAITVAVDISTTTAAAVRTAVNADPEASLLVSAALAPANDGTGLVTAMSVLPLTGGGIINMYQGVSTITIVGSFRGEAQTDALVFTNDTNSKDVAVEKYRAAEGIKPFDEITSITIDHNPDANFVCSIYTTSRFGLPLASDTNTVADIISLDNVGLIDPESDPGSGYDAVDFTNQTFAVFNNNFPATLTYKIDLDEAVAANVGLAVPLSEVPTGTNLAALTDIDVLAFGGDDL